MKRTKNGWVLDEICGQMYVYLTLCAVCSVEIYECRDFYVAHEIFFIHGTISTGTPSKYLQVKLYVHYTNHILYVHYTNISMPTSPTLGFTHFLNNAIAAIELSCASSRNTQSYSIPNGRKFKAVGSHNISA